MSNIQRLRRKREIFQAEFDALCERIEQLRVEMVYEVQIPTRMQLEKRIREDEVKRDEVEQELDALDRKIEQAESPRQKTQEPEAQPVPSLPSQPAMTVEPSEPQAPKEDAQTYVPVPPTAEEVHTDQAPVRPVAQPSAADILVSDHAITTISKNSAIRWVRIPAGSFKRGCPKEFITYITRKFGHGSDVLHTYPERVETIDEFWISLTSITNAQYYAFVRATGHRYPVGWLGTMPPYRRSDADKPVVGVTWQDGVDFAEWLEAGLPSRAEYEKACRGEAGWLYPWGNNFDPAKCNTAETSHGNLTPVTAFPEGKSVYGVLDLVGNVWEWSNDEHEYEDFRMTVGASYRSTGEVYGAGFFDVSRPQESYEDNLGFRIACRDIRQLDVMNLEFEE